MKFCLLGLLLLCGGCATTIETVRVDPQSMRITSDAVPGVLYYEPRLVRVRYEFTQLMDRDKGLIGTAEDGGCRRTLQKEDLVTLPDYQRPRAILYKPSWFAAGEFGVTLNNGMLVAVNAKSTPQGPQLAEQLVKATALVTLLPVASGGIACNAGAVISAGSVLQLDDASGH